MNKQDAWTIIGMFLIALVVVFYESLDMGPLWLSILTGGILLLAILIAVGTAIVTVIA